MDIVISFFTASGIAAVPNSPTAKHKSRRLLLLLTEMENRNVYFTSGSQVKSSHISHIINSLSLNKAKNGWNP